MFQFNSFFLECEANSDRLGKELRIAEENLKKDLRGKNEIVLFFEIDWNEIDWNGNSATSNDLETAKTNLASTKTELNSTKSAVADLATKLIGKL